MRERRAVVEGWEGRQQPVAGAGSGVDERPGQHRDAVADAGRIREVVVRDRGHVGPDEFAADALVGWAEVAGAQAEAAGVTEWDFAAAALEDGRRRPTDDAGVGRGARGQQRVAEGLGFREE